MKRLQSLIFLFYAIAQTFCLQYNSKCFTPDEYTGTCIKLSKCEPLKRLRYKCPTTHSDRLFVTLSLCGYRGHEPLVCCKSVTQPVDRSSHVPTETVKNPLPHPSQCASYLEERIFGGEETKIDEFPFSALLLYKTSHTNNEEYSFNCGGSLITQRFVLTAAHCVHQNVLSQKQWELNFVRLGEFNLDTNPDCSEGMRENYVCAPPYVDVPIEQKIVHESYNEKQQHDIALLKLKQNVVFNDFVKPVCLPLDKTLKTDHLNSVVSGFGKVESGVLSKIKLKTELTIFSNDECKAIADAAYHSIISSQMCAIGNDGKDSCNGDSGNALIYVNTQSSHAHWVVLGITSFGPSPCGQEIPGVYTRVSDYIPWIMSKLI